MAAALVASAGLACQAASIEEIMASRYLRTLVCMGHALGQNYAQRLQIDMYVNRWGISEPYEHSIQAQSAKVRQVDHACRAANEIADEPRLWDR